MNALIWTLVQLFGLALALITVLLGAWALVRLAPMTQARRRSLEQWFPILQLISILGFLVLGVQGLFSEPAYRALAVLLILFFGLWLARYTWMDLWHGAFLRAGGHVKVGDTITVEPWQGRVSRLGPRVLTIETQDGSDAIIPYSRLAARTIVRTPRVDGAHRYTFEVDVPSTDWTPQRLQRVALMHHWSTPSKPPEVKSVAADRFAVTVFALLPQHAADIERDVVKAVSQA
ncbi:MAG: mechanosensitive ion channel domain-containing protein [Myxococcota bacterium]